VPEKWTCSAGGNRLIINQITSKEERRPLRDNFVWGYATTLKDFMWQKNTVLVVKIIMQCSANMTRADEGGGGLLESAPRGGMTCHNVILRDARRPISIRESKLRSGASLTMCQSD
jgi:hypothetical protein